MCWYAKSQSSGILWFNINSFKITNCFWRLNWISEKLSSDPEKKLTKTDWLQINFLTEQQNFFKCVFFCWILWKCKHQKQFSYQKHFENNQKNPILPSYVQTQSTLKWSCWKAHFIALEKTAFNSVPMLSWNCLVKMFCQKNTAFPKPRASEEETDILFYSDFEGKFWFSKK